LVFVCACVCVTECVKWAFVFFGVLLEN
jgi:hypothetical protein